jgi:predicted N-acyltransferase
MHWIVDPRFRTAIAEYLQREGEDRDDYERYIASHVPYRNKAR